MIRIGVIGLGYWGPNLVRCFDSIRDCRVTAVCDLNTQRLSRIHEQFPHIRCTVDESEILTRKCVDAVAVATPTRTHFTVARRGLEQGLHTFVEKPLATTSGQCRALIDLADRQEVTLFVGHVFLYSAPVAKLKELEQVRFIGMGKLLQIPAQSLRRRISETYV